MKATGLKFIDDTIGGIHKRVVLIVGSTHSYKTGLAMDIAVNNTLGGKQAFFSTSAYRLDAVKNIIGRMQNNGIETCDLPIIDKLSNTQGYKVIHVDCDERLTYPDLMKIEKKMKEIDGVAFVTVPIFKPSVNGIVDLRDLILPGGSGGSRRLDLDMYTVIQVSSRSMGEAIVADVTFPQFNKKVTLMINSYLQGLLNK